jgi:hypothetical protein
MFISPYRQHLAGSANRPIGFVQLAQFSDADFLDRSGSRRRLWLCTVLPGAVANGSLRIADAGVTSSPNPLWRYFGTEWFDGLSFSASCNGWPLIPKAATIDWLGI